MKFKFNSEKTWVDRLLVVLGWVSVTAGFFILSIVNAIYQGSNIVVWLVGIGLVVGGILMARTVGIIESFVSHWWF